jgi:6-phosphogluconolactonase
LAEAGARIVTVTDPVAEAAVLIVRAIESADRSRGSARLAIPGGSAAAAVGRIRLGLAPGVWRRLRLTWVDERCVPFGHADSNRGSAHRAGLLDPDDPPAVDRALVLDGETPDASRTRAEAALLLDFGGAIDVALLGMGEDGHIASLFPGHAVLSERALVALVRDSPKPPAERVTLTLPALRTATTSVLIVTGEAKRDAVTRLAQGDRRLPATLLGNIVVMTDIAI